MKTGSHLAMLLMVAFACPAYATKFEGTVTGVLDGDTIKVLHDGHEDVVRLNSIDCPEKEQPFRQEAKKFTSTKCFGRRVTIDSDKHDRYKRTLGDVILQDGSLLNAELVRAGLAWWYRYFAPDNKVLERLEQQARDAKRGLWADPNPTPPWEFRHRRQHAASTSVRDDLSSELTDDVAVGFENVAPERLNMSANHADLGDLKDALQSSQKSELINTTSFLSPVSMEHAPTPSSVFPLSSLHAPLTGNVEQISASAKKAPLTGGVEKIGLNALPQALTGGVEKVAPAISLFGQTPQSGASPLAGHVSDEQARLLQGQVDRSQLMQAPDLRALNPSGAGVMRIIQYKTIADPVHHGNLDASGDKSSVLLSPRLDGGNVPEQRISENSQAPQREVGENLRPTRDSTQGRPTRELSIQPPIRSQTVAPPDRSSDNSLGAPVRTISIQQAPIIAPDRYLSRPPIRIAGAPGLAPGRELYLEQPPIRIPGRSTAQPPIQIAYVQPGPANRFRKWNGTNETMDSYQTETMVGDPSNSIAAKQKHKKHRENRETGAVADPMQLGSANIPRTALSAAPATVPGRQEPESLLWDRWYAHLNELLCAALKNTMQAHQNPSGSCRIKVTVSPTYRVTATVLQATNAAFGRAVRDGYLALSGNPSLQFPPNTKRTLVEYESEHVQEFAGPTGVFDAHSIKGDREIIN